VIKKVAIAALLVALLCPCASAGEITAERLAKRVGQVFAGYNDFWVWVTQRFRDADGNEANYRGRVYFLRPRMFRLNFGQPPFLVHGTDGREYWVYKSEQKIIEVSDLGEGAPVHVLFQVFAAGDQMVRALDRFFNVDALEEGAYTDPKSKKKIPAYKLVISLKPERIKEMREKAGNKFTDEDAKQIWTFWIDKKTYLPRLIQVDGKGKTRYIFELDKFHHDIGLSPKLFRRPTPAGVKIVDLRKK
jgi:outer membrane lipoprotein-sorting protein